MRSIKARQEVEAANQARLDGLFKDLESGMLTPEGQQFATRRLVDAGRALPEELKFDSDTKNLYSNNTDQVPSLPKNVYEELISDGIFTEAPFVKKEQSARYNLLLRPKGAHAAEKPHFFTRAKRFAKAIGSSLLVSDYESTALENYVKKSTGPRHAKPVVNRVKFNQEHPKALSRRLARLTLGVLVLGSSFSLLGQEKLDDSQLLRQPAITSTQTPNQESNNPNFFPAESAATATPLVENEVVADNLTPEVSETPASITVTVEDGSNIWNATKSELEKINPEVSNPEVAYVVNGIIWFYNLSNPDIVQPNTQFEIDLDTLLSLR